MIIRTSPNTIFVVIVSPKKITLITIAISGTRKLNDPILPASPDRTSKKKTSQVSAEQKIAIMDNVEMNC